MPLRLPRQQPRAELAAKLLPLLFTDHQQHAVLDSGFAVGISGLDEVQAARCDDARLFEVGLHLHRATDDEHLAPMGMMMGWNRHPFRHSIQPRFDVVVPFPQAAGLHRDPPHVDGLPALIFGSEVSGHREFASLASLPWRRASVLLRGPAIGQAVRP